MAVSVPVLAVTQAGASGVTATTASFTPLADAVLIAFCAFRGSSGVIPSISDSIGGTWTPIAVGQDAGFVGGRLFYQETGSSPVARTVTCTSTGATQTGIAIVVVTGTGTDFSNYHFDITTGSSQTVNMDPYTSGSYVLAGTVDNSGGTQNYPGAFTELFDSAVATNLRMSIAYMASATAPTSINITGSASDNYVWGIEIKEGGGAAVLTANSLTSATSAEVATMTQTHDLDSSDITSIASVSTPSIGSSSGMTANNVSSTMTVGASTLGTVEVLSANDISTATTTGLSTLGQANDLVAADISTVPTAGEGTMGQVENLIAVSLSTAPFIGSPLLTQITGEGGIFDDYIGLRIGIC
jgi:hypothetical protein